MNLHVIDTDHVSLFHRSYPFVVQHWAEANPDTLAVTIITLEEQIRGRFASLKQAKECA
jgi:tRNA(fMet)-specific endonuclease VapC